MALNYYSIIYYSCYNVYLLLGYLLRRLDPLGGAMRSLGGAAGN